MERRLANSGPHPGHKAELRVLLRSTHCRGSGRFLTAPTPGEPSGILSENRLALLRRIVPLTMTTSLLFSVLLPES